MRALRAILAVAYPFLILAGLRVASPRLVALAIGGVLVLRAILAGHVRSLADLRPLVVPGALVATVVLMTALLDDPRFLFFAPALVSIALLVAFGRTLLSGPSFVERLARIRVPDLPEDEAVYCRSVTKVWCVFFSLNAAVAIGLALVGNVRWWALYTGFVAYLLIALLYGVEFVVRAARFGRYEGTLVEPIFRRLFPHGHQL